MYKRIPKYHCLLLDFILIFQPLTGQVLGLSFSMLDPSSLLFSHTDWAAQEPDLPINCGVTRKKTGMSHTDREDK